MSEDREWTDVDLDRLRQLDARRIPVGQIAEELQRSSEDIQDRLHIVRDRAPRPVIADVGAMTQAMGDMVQTMSRASEVPDDEVEIAADDAGATAAAQKIGTALEDEQPDTATRELHEADERGQQATSPIGTRAQDAASQEIDRKLIRQADENAERTDKQMRKAGFGDHKGTEGV